MILTDALAAAITSNNYRALQRALKLARDTHKHTLTCALTAKAQTLLAEAQRLLAILSEPAQEPENQSKSEPELAYATNCIPKQAPTNASVLAHIREIAPKHNNSSVPFSSIFPHFNDREGTINALYALEQAGELDLSNLVTPEQLEHAITTYGDESSAGRIFFAEPTCEPAPEPEPTDALTDALTRIRELETSLKHAQRIIEAQQQLINDQQDTINALQEPAPAPTPAPEPAEEHVHQLLNTITELAPAHNNYVPVYEVFTRCTSREATIAAIYALECAGKIDLSSLAEPADFTPEQLEHAIPSYGNEFLFFISLV